MNIVYIYVPVKHLFTDPFLLYKVISRGDILDVLHGWRGLVSIENDQCRQVDKAEVLLNINMFAAGSVHQ